ncbi:FAD/NAD(P)-binding domain-containing protein [Rhizopogon vinicolor AM-OR11-026]|uniref:FAD/NAD(P)-binding domain-containing protein n=1 Tax=Rhizopogon vinicolor AM-OR11-026 TaxID=1314800 RepID=A0A1B7NAZ3_9AGAM|nr:FAD/NAD(P)-binding domain-containing protein [Rhizopogon vinicolor AM-OR11-026]
MEILPNDPLNLLNQKSECEKRICVIGAAAGGLIALKVISDSAYVKSGKWSVIAYEARTNVGGIWFPSPPVADSYGVPLTPLYDSLTTNLPHPVMGYTSYSFPPETPLFPRAHVVQTYLESFAAHFNLMPLIKFGTTVLDARWESTQWILTLSDGEQLAYDHLVVANGHYHIPRIPDLPGLADWVKHGKAFHSAWYRKPDFLGSKVLIVGGGPSGDDIAAEMCTVATVVVHALSKPPAADDISPDNLILRGRAIEFRANGQVIFEDGTVEDDIDRCILATGFQNHLPFLEVSSMINKSMPPDIPPLIPGELFNSTYHIFPLEKHLFPLQTRYPVSSVAFVGLLMWTSPFPLMEAQAHAIVRAFADPSSLDPITEAADIIARAEKLRSVGASTSLAVAKAWVRLVGDEQWIYRDELYEFAEGVESETETPPIKVREWEKECFELRAEMRSAWEGLEKSGKAGEWLKDVGKNGVQDWVDLMYRVLDYAGRRSSSASARL